MDVFNDIHSLAVDCTKDPISCLQKVEKFNKDHESVFHYSSILKQQEYNKLLESVLILLLDDTFRETLHLKLLCMLRLLSRDKQLVCNIVGTEKHITNFVQFMENLEKDSNDNNLCLVQGLMCLSNWIYQSSKVRQALVRLDYVKGTIVKLQASGIKVDNFLFYQFRVLFLMTALENKQQMVALQNGGINASVSILRTILEEINISYTLDEMSDKVLSELLKALFNVTRILSDCSSEKISQDCASLVVLLRELIKMKTIQDSESQISHISHVFVNLNKESLVNICPIEETMEDEQKFLEHPLYYQKFNMSAVIILMESLRNSIKIKTFEKMMEKTLAILTFFCYACRKIPQIRKYLRQEILPPLIISTSRPEERDDLCGDIIRLMTSVDITLKNMAADFIFVLCKENVNRLIRYSGYGNCVGYLASRGLMVPVDRHADGEYSDDELSDVDDNLDAMTGARSKPKSSILDHLTEEEKEVEAMKLMNLFDKLNGPNSLIKPMTVNTDGKLVELDMFKNENEKESND